jgi:ATP-binding cassette subfamily B protein
MIPFMPPNNELELRPKGSSLKPLKAIVPFISPYKKTLTLALIVLVAASAATGSLPLAARYLIDNGIATGDSDKIDFYFQVVIGVILAMNF